MKDEQVEVFEHVFESLLEGADASALVDISGRLAPIENAPPKIMRRLANADAIEVAAPILQFSPRLTTDDLLDIARAKGNGHLWLFPRRKSLEETVTDILITRGDTGVAATLAGNTTARLSSSGLQTLLQKATKNDDVAEQLISRNELSPQALNAVVAALERAELAELRTTLKKLLD